MPKKEQVSEGLRLARKQRLAHRRDNLRGVRLRRGRVRKRRPPPPLLRHIPRRVTSGGFFCLRSPLTQFEQGVLKSYQCALAHKPVEAYRLARRVLTHQPHLAPLLARTALVLAQDAVPLEGLDLTEEILSLGYAIPPLIRAYARILGSLGYHREALLALRRLGVSRR